MDSVSSFHIAFSLFSQSVPYFLSLLLLSIIFSQMPTEDIVLSLTEFYTLSIKV
jgi:hypothetical protein